jgi:hypothetical protein
VFYRAKIICFLCRRAQKMTEAGKKGVEAENGVISG